MRSVLAVALLALAATAARAVVIPLEHSFDGSTFSPAGSIVFGDDVLMKQAGVGSFERASGSDGALTQLEEATRQGGLYVLRAAETGVPRASAPFAATPAACIPRSLLPALSVSLLSEGGVGSISFDGGCDADTSDPAAASSNVLLSFPLPGGTLVGSDAANQLAVAAPATPAAAGSNPATPLGSTPTPPREGASGEMTEEEKKAEEMRIKREAWEKKSWIEKNWMILIPGVLLLLNRMGQNGAQAGGGGAAPQRR